jgi:SAM-dependent methyltransferase
MEEIKERITSYWTRRAPSFRQQRLRELDSAKAERWIREMTPYFPDKASLRVLDLGTGTGFFAFLLARMGHEVIGIDLTEEMILEARECAEELELDVSFHVMDAEHPVFRPGRFDVLVTRNLTWTLPHLPEAYRAWYDLLAPGGVLINFDADYGAVLEQEEPEELPPEHAHKNIAPEMKVENDIITREIHSHQKARPLWDTELLLAAGFEKITIDTGVWERIYAEIDEFYNSVHIFTVAARKGE